MKRSRENSMRTASLLMCAAVLVVGCGASTSSGGPAESPGSSSSAPSEDDASLPEGEEVPPKSSRTEGDARRGATDGGSSSDGAPSRQEETQGEGAAPEFRPGMTVNEAIQAVPPNADRVNVDQETLEEPLVRSELYEPCKLTSSQRFKLRVAVWEGRAVGVDVETLPKNEKLAACLRQQIDGVRWSSKAKSLNTVEYAF